MAQVLLCIDDDVALLQIRQLVLQSAGYEVRVAASGVEGLHIFQNERVDAVLLDFAMPGLDGGEVARRMRQLKPAVPIVLLSAYLSLPQDVLHNVDAYVPKGQPPAVLLHELNHLFAAKRLARGECAAAGVSGKVKFPWAA